MRVWNPDPAVNSLSGYYPDPANFSIFGRRRSRNQVKASEGRRGEERTRCRWPQSTDRGRLMRAGEREGRGVRPGVCISGRPTNIST